MARQKSRLAGALLLVWGALVGLDFCTTYGAGGAFTSTQNAPTTRPLQSAGKQNIGHSREELPAVATEDQQTLRNLIARHRACDTEAWATLGVTLLLWTTGLAALHLSAGHWAAMGFMALSMVRCFIVFHDASHRSFFESAASNKQLAQVIQFFVNYSFEEWDAVHNSHHAHFGDSSVWDKSLTIWFSEGELEEAPWFLRWGHRLLRDPLVFFPLAGVFVFFMNKPLIHGPYRAVLPIIISLTLGMQTALAYIAAGCLAGVLGVAAFHLQHGCNTPYRAVDRSARSSLDAAMMGSTRIPLPWPLSVFSLGIEYHHIHHFDVRVPGYRLERCDAEGQSLGLWERVNTISAERAFKSLFHTHFEGSTKFAGSDGEQPRFASFWPYSAMGLQDA